MLGLKLIDISLTILFSNCHEVTSVIWIMLFGVWKPFPTTVMLSNFVVCVFCCVMACIYRCQLYVQLHLWSNLGRVNGSTWLALEGSSSWWHDCCQLGNFISCRSVIGAYPLSMHCGPVHMTVILQTAFCRCILLDENLVFKWNSLTYVPWGLINNNTTLVQIMTWRRTGDEPLFDPMMVRFTAAYIRRHSASMS